MKLIYFLIAVLISCQRVSAETRWCNILRIDPADTLKYPLIARAARISDVLVARVTFLPSGRVTSLKPLFHAQPPLFKLVSSQVASWTMKTDAVGEQLCQGLMILEFRFKGVGTSDDLPAGSAPTGMLRMRVVAGEAPRLCDDPEPTVTKRHWWSHRWYVQ